MPGRNQGVWITGASSGIGKAAVKECARVGFKVFASARRINELERINEELKKEKLEIVPIACNVASSSNVDQTIKKIVAEHSVKILINNAGITEFKSLENTSIKEINDIINTNLLGSIYPTKYFLPYFIKQGGGTIINILSTAANQIFTNSSIYTASKTGLKGFAEVLREEVRNYNIRVINIFPGPTDTPMWPSETRKENAQKMMTPEEVARIIVWSALQEGNLVTEDITIRPILGNL